MLRAACCALALLLTCPSLGFSQEWAKKMFETTSHDFGAVARGGKTEFEFVVKNIYKEKVHIASVTSSCGCTTPSIKNDSLKTWEKGAILAEFNTRTFIGQRSATLTVTIDEPFYAQVQLHVSGYIRTDIVLEPGGVEFGSVDQGTTADKSLTITYAGRGDWKIQEIKSGSPYLVAELGEPSRTGGHTSYQLKVTLTEDAPVGYVKEQITLVTNDKRSSEIAVDVEGRVVAALTISPSSLFMGALQPGQKVTKQIVVQGKKPFHVTKVSCEDEGFKFQVPKSSKAVHLIPVTFVAGDTPGKMTYSIKIETDLGADAQQELLASALIIEPGDDEENEE